MYKRTLAVIFIVPLLLAACGTLQSYGEAVHHNQLGLEYLNQNDWEKALLEFNLAIESDPEYAEAYYGRELIYHKMGELERAIADYDRAIELDPQYAWAYYERGYTYYDLEESEKAIADLERALELGLPAEPQAEAESMLAELNQEGK